MSGLYSNLWFERDDHAIYISVVEIKRDANAIGVVSIKVFQNDLSDALRNFSNKKSPYDLTKDCGIYSDVINDYFNKYSSIIIDGTTLELALNDCEMVGDSYWLNFTSETPIIWHEVQVKTVFLMELFPTQTNIITVNYQEGKRMFKLTKSQPENTVSF
jgi:hypothetical protein